MPSASASSVAYMRVSSSTCLLCPGMVATGSFSPKASTVVLLRVVWAVYPCTTATFFPLTSK